jgi:hypothetical protein
MVIGVPSSGLKDISTVPLRMKYRYSAGAPCCRIIEPAWKGIGSNKGLSSSKYSFFRFSKAGTSFRSENINLY